MEIKESGDERVYLAGYGVPTIKLGCGGVIISDIHFDNEIVAGIGFTLGSGAVGDDHPELRGKDVTEARVFLQIIATKPESLQIVIDKLIKAKADLKSKVLDV